MSPESNSHEKPPDRPPEPTKTPGREVGWVDHLAQRSAGLHSAPPPPPAGEKSPWSFAGMGLQFAATTGIFTGMGLFIDAHWHTSPWGTVGLTLLGIVGGMYLLIKEALKANAEPKKDGDASRRPKDGPA